DLEPVARLLGGPELVGDDRDGAAVDERDLEDVLHSGDAARVRVIHALPRGAKHRWPSQERRPHAGEIEIHAELLGTVAFRPAIKTPDPRSDEAKFSRRLQ